MRATAEQRTHSLKIEEYQVEAYVYLVTGTALGELNHPNPLEPQKFKKRSSRHRNVKEKRKIRERPLYCHPRKGGDPCINVFIL